SKAIAMTVAPMSTTWVWAKTAPPPSEIGSYSSESTPAASGSSALAKRNLSAPRLKMSPVGLRTGARILFTRASSMHPADHYPVNQEPLPPEATLTLDSEPEVEAMIASLKQHFEAVRQREVKRVRGRLGELNSTQENAIESLTHGIIDRILHAPITVLKAASEDNDSLAVIETFQRIFSLGERPGRDSAV